VLIVFRQKRTFLHNSIASSWQTAHYERLGDSAKSLENAEKIIEIDGNNREAMEMIKRLEKE